MTAFLLLPLVLLALTMPAMKREWVDGDAQKAHTHPSRVEAGHKPKTATRRVVEKNGHLHVFGEPVGCQQLCEEFLLLRRPCADEIVLHEEARRRLCGNEEDAVVADKPRQLTVCCRKLHFALVEIFEDFVRLFVPG